MYTYIYICIACTYKNKALDVYSNILCVLLYCFDLRTASPSFQKINQAFKAQTLQLLPDPPTRSCFHFAHGPLG